MIVLLLIALVAFAAAELGIEKVVTKTCSRKSQNGDTLKVFALFLLMLLFWKGTTRQGIIAGVLVGLISSLLWVFATPDMYTAIYKADAKGAWAPLNQPGIVTIPLSFFAIVLASKMTRAGTSSRAV